MIMYKWWPCHEHWPKVNGYLHSEHWLRTDGLSHQTWEWLLIGFNSKDIQSEAINSCALSSTKEWKGWDDKCIQETLTFHVSLIHIKALHHAPFVMLQTQTLSPRAWVQNAVDTAWLIKQNNPASTKVSTHRTAGK